MFLLNTCHHVVLVSLRTSPDINKLQTQFIFTVRSSTQSEFTVVFSLVEILAVVRHEMVDYIRNNLSVLDLNACNNHVVVNALNHWSLLHAIMN
ncbi:unnamed protein product [Amoebophrya sp. A25]|nr:unnamed protein product [Amoebophrya sp. A25]|eukprot:GSA25T00012788001.1